MTPVTESIESLVPGCVAEVLETMFFAETTPAGSDDTAAAFPAGQWFCIRVDFAGSPSGRFWLWLAHTAAARLGADFLGLEFDEVDADKALQTASELANMICGSIVSRIESNAAFRLSAPAAVDPEASGASTSKRRFQIEGGSLWVAFEVDTT